MGSALRIEDETKPMMSSSNTDHRARGPTAQRVVSVVTESVAVPVRVIAFWMTVLLPVLALLLVVTGLASVTFSTAVGFLVLYSACAITGHDHDPN